jgi:transcriptional regulator GlxA family with amidase domain
MSQARQRTLGAVLYENFELLDLYGPLEMFGALDPFGAQEKQVQIVTVAQKKGPIASSPGVETLARYDFSDCPALDLILLPGGFGTIAELANPALLEFLRKRAASAEVTMSVCSGSALLDGRRATSNKVFFQLARSQSDRVNWVTEARWVEDWPFVTSSGVSAGTDMALAVIARLFGKDAAEQVAIGTEYSWHRDANVDPFAKYLDQGMAAAKPA